VQSTGGHFRLRAEPDCNQVRDQMLRLRAEAQQKLDGMDPDYAEEQHGCDEEAEEYDHEIEGIVHQAGIESTELAEATAEEIDRHSMWQQRSAELQTLQKEYNQEVKTCNSNIASLQSEICALRKIRGEFSKQEGGKDYFQDCQVSAWAEGVCSVPCGGGGRRELTRTVISPPVRGAGCPPLKLMQNCGAEKCPVDCRVGVWSGWSECSALCGGGIKERMRKVLQKAEHGGQPCGSVTDAQECNAQACNQDCKLSKWTEWSACSATCGSGTQQRTRKVRELAVGTGSCPGPHSHDRANFRMCQLPACERPKNQRISKCKSKVDVALLVDGSSAISAADWNLMRRAASMVVEALIGDGSNADGPRVALQVFGGKLSAKCAQGGAGEVIDLKDCGITWLSHIRDKTEGDLAKKIGDLQFPAGSALTHTALSGVEMELHYGRMDAPSVVVVLTAGEPMDMHLTGEVSMDLQEFGSRVMWVPILRRGLQASHWAPLQEMKHWVSLPLQENLVVVEGFKTLATPVAVSRLVDEICAAHGR